MSKFRAFQVFIAMAATAFALMSPSARAQFPERPVTLLIPTTAGGTADLLGRLVAQKLADTWATTVVVENRPGALGIIATEALARSKADGYTLGLFPSNHAILPLVRKNLSFDFQKDLTPVAPVATAPGVLVTNQRFGQVGDVKQVFDFAKRRPGALNYAIPVPLTNGHRTMELLKYRSGIDVQGIPYKGGAQAVTDLIGDQVQLLIIAIPSVISHIEAGTLRPLAVTSSSRFSGLPDVPTLSESVFPGFESVESFGLFAPAGVPSEIAQKIADDVQKVLGMPDVAQRLHALGAIPSPGGGVDLKTAFEKEYNVWAGLLGEVDLLVD
ncbi:tripartite tricarboxylate transporter substrate binding protein [Verticiella sediminum]|uniref:Tripartite tricarboxylate transporter substrate binding protein n=1 Tax=Verticiella sediminum TaxID=1247510 RepID=A0A556A822_9BURK|nr:tripartite tricarboxylate transporter substrate-binding protein [Verticiella sediminum]TSH89036.1 tripartite tricarboxylate transporter substrate binding protein [Verticiella sediminum]